MLMFWCFFMLSAVPALRVGELEGVSTGCLLLLLCLFLLGLLLPEVCIIYEMIMKSNLYRCHGLGRRCLQDKVCLVRGW